MKELKKVEEVPTKMLGTASLENDISVKLSLNELLEIVVEEKNAERAQYRKSLLTFQHELFQQLEGNIKKAFRKQFSKELITFEKLFGETRFNINVTAFSINAYWREATFNPLGVSIDNRHLNYQVISTHINNGNWHHNHNQNLTDLQSLALFAQDPRGFQHAYHPNQLDKMTILFDINLKDIRIKVNKELLSRKSMTNQEIYERVTELVAIPDEIKNYVADLKKTLTESYGLSPEEIIQSWKASKQI